MKLIELKGIIDDEYVELFWDTESQTYKFYDSVRFDGEPEKMFEIYGNARVDNIGHGGTDGDEILCISITREGDYE